MPITGFNSFTDGLGVPGKQYAIRVNWEVSKKRLFRHLVSENRNIAGPAPFTRRCSVMSRAVFDGILEARSPVLLRASSLREAPSPSRLPAWCTS
jgi:hypothetical protein